MKKKSSTFRVALMGIFHESNTFIDGETNLKNFEEGRLLRGEAIRKEYEEAHHEIGGMLEVMDREGIEVIPILFASATPGGVVTDETYRLLLEEMIGRLREVLPVDGCLAAPHGAGVVKNTLDMDGHWLSAVREAVGPNIPIVGTLDPHANLSQQMVDATDALVAYATNPHIDQRQTGKRAAELLVASLQGRVKLKQRLAQPPVAISIEQQYTSDYPCALLYKAAKELSAQREILSISILLGFPYADVPEMGASFLVVANDDINRGSAAINQLQRLLIEFRKEFVGNKESLDVQLNRIEGMEKPALLLDMGDNVGGGSPGDSVYLFKALEEHGRYTSFACVFDAAAVEKAAAHTPGEVFELSFGNDYAQHDAKPYQARVTLLATVDGKFREETPRHGGERNYNMGKTVILRTEKGNTAMIHSLRTPPFSLNQLTAFGIDPKNFDAVAAKGVNAPIAAYGPVCPTIVQVDSPGVTQADMTRFVYKNRRQPLYPFEELIF